MKPTGVDFDVVIDGEKQTYYIKPDVFSESTMTKLAAYVKAKRSETRREMLRDIADASKGLPEEAIKAMTQEVIRNGLDNASVDYETAVQALQSADGEGLAIALEMNVEGINSRAEARKVMGAYPNVADLMSKVVQAGVSALEAAAEYDPQSGLGN
jgi:hypothetical protein